MGKGARQTQDVQQRQTADTTFNNQQFQQQLQQQLQQQQQAYQNQQAQSQQHQAQTGVDAASQAYIDQMRQHALSSLGGIGAAQFAPTAGQVNTLTSQLMNPYMQQVVGGVGQQFDQLRGQAAQQTDQAATAAGAFGGSRHGVATGQRLAELDRAQAQQVGQLLAGGHAQAQQAAIPMAAQQAMAPAQAAMFGQSLLAGGLGPTGQVSTGSGITTGATSGQQSGTQTSSLTNLGFGSQSGHQNVIGNLSGRTTTSEAGNWFNDLLALGNVAAAFMPGG